MTPGVPEPRQYTIQPYPIRQETTKGLWIGLWNAGGVGKEFEMSVILHVLYY